MEFAKTLESPRTAVRGLWEHLSYPCFSWPGAMLTLVVSMPTLLRDVGMARPIPISIPKATTVIWPPLFFLTDHAGRDVQIRGGCPARDQ